MGIISDIRNTIAKGLRWIAKLIEEPPIIWEPPPIPPKRIVLNIVLKIDYESHRGRFHNFKLNEEMTIETDSEHREEDIAKAVETLKERARIKYDSDGITEMIELETGKQEHKQGEIDYIIGIEEV